MLARVDDVAAGGDAHFPLVRDRGQRVPHAAALCQQLQAGFYAFQRLEAGSVCSYTSVMRDRGQCEAHSAAARSSSRISTSFRACNRGFESFIPVVQFCAQP